MTETRVSNSQPVVIIGAGPAGLTASYELSKLGVRSTVLEADNQVGGLSRTVSYRNYRFDIGGHRFFSKQPYVNQIWNEILDDDFLVRSRLSRIHYRGHFFDYPLKAFKALLQLGPLEAFLILLSYSKAKLHPIENVDNFEQWVSSRFGSRLYNIFFKTYTEKVWGLPCHEISADWAAQRIKNLSLKEAVRNALFSNRNDKSGEIITTLIEQFHYPKLGPGMMWERCEELLTQQGNPTIHGAKIVRVRHTAGKVECVYTRGGSSAVQEFSGSHFLSSMPLRELIYALDPIPPKEILAAAGCLRYRDYLTVVLIVNRKDIFPDNWIYIHTPEVKMGRIQNYKNWSPAMVPDQAKTSLGLEYFLWEEDEEWRWPEERLIELGIRECSQLGLIEPNDVEDGTVVRMKKAYPIYDHNYEENLEKLHHYLKSFSNLESIGRNGLHRYNNQDHSMITGVYAARNVVGENYDVWSVNEEKVYHEEIEKERPPVKDRLIPIRIQPVEELSQMTREEVVEYVFARLDPLALGIAIGSVFGVGTFLLTSILLLKGGPTIGPTLSLLANYMPGYKVTWSGAIVGFLEAGIIGLFLGYTLAMLRNWGMTAYAFIIHRKTQASENKDLLDKL